MGCDVTKLLLPVLLLVSVASPAFAWVYPEHREIGVLAIETLDPEHRAIFERLWREARAGHEDRLCENGADPALGLHPDCIDWAAMPAIAGDHSCSSSQMLDTILSTEWVLEVAAVGAQLKANLARIPSVPPRPGREGEHRVSDLRRQFESEAARAQRLNALRVSDIAMQSADPEMATRAASNYAHFLLARPTVDFTAEEYLATTLRPGSEISAIGTFGWYHLSAMQKASRLARETLTPPERSALARAVLADEAFSLHFLEDVYAAGHVAGTWGDVSQRKGTHDYYNEHGLEVATWQGGSKTMVLMGDAYMRPEDAERAAAVVRMSLEQILDIAAARLGDFPYTAEAPAEPETFDVCKNNSLVQRPEGLRVTPEALRLGVKVLLQTPIPSLGEGLGAMPRFRAEIGPFIGAAGSLEMRHVDRGFTGFESGGGFLGGADLSLRAGLGLEGVLDEAGDGLIFLSLGYRGDSPSTNKFTTAAAAQEGGTLTAAIPGRTGYSVRVRMPFYLVPGDLVLLSPLYFISRKTYQDIAIASANGGLIPWQLGWATPFGRFQFVLGRELGVALYGRQRRDTLLAPGATPGAGTRVIKLRSTYFDIPILEYRPYRAFDVSQSSELIVQVHFGVDVPDAGRVIAPTGAPEVKLQRVYSVGARIVFDWRHYF